MQNNFNTNQYPCSYPQLNPNAVNINIISPQAYGSTQGVTCPIEQNNNGFYSLYGQNQNPNLPLYPQNYNNLVHPQGYNPNAVNQQNPNQQTYPQQQYTPNTPQNYLQQQQIPSNNAMPLMDTNSGDSGLNNASNLTSETNLINKTNTQDVQNSTTETKTKKITPLTNEYIQSLENYMNNDNPKIRLIGAKEVMERFKEDENRKDNPSLTPLLNKALRDINSAVRFLALTTLQLGYAVGNDETVTILKEIQSQNNDKVGEDSLLASDILLNMSAGQKIDVPMTQKEIDEMNAKKKKGEDK